MQGYCSWCFKQTKHIVTQENNFRRNVCRCNSCRNHTLICRSPGCKHFTKAHPAEYPNESPGSILGKLKENWHSEFCAEHDGTIASFDRLAHRLEDLQDYKVIFEGRKLNMVKTTTMTTAVIGGAVVIGATAGFGAPAYAAAMGKLGVLGAASTGTAISSLTGAALTSASLAAIGSGGMFFITATGAALGGILGGTISNKYVGEIEDFDIIQYNEGDGASVIFVNGFLNQKNDNLEDWRSGAKQVFKDNSWYLTTWESKKKASIGKIICGNAGKAAIAGYFTNLAKQATRKAGSKINPLAMAAVLSDILGNDWHSAMAKAAMTGILLADLISRTPSKKYILVGHSLGARVIYYALEALSTRTESPLIQDVILLGGAVGAEDQSGWKSSANAVSGNIHNCFSNKDDVLRYAYKGANAFLSEPIGLRSISTRSRKIKNWDCSDFINSHMDWKPKLADVISRINYKTSTQK